MVLMGLMVIFTSLVTTSQGWGFGVIAFSVRVNLPAAISAADGVYTAFNVFLSGAKVPVPPTHAKLCGWVPVMVPANWIAVFGQTPN
jgi:hypothetical protein